MVHYEQQQEAESTRQPNWMRWSAISAIVGGILAAVVYLYVMTDLNPQEFELITTPAHLAGLLLALALPAYYVSEHHWFDRVAQVGFGMMAVGMVIAAIALPIADYGPGVAIFAFMLGVLVLALGSLVFGIAMLRTKAAPRTAAWLLIAALTIGLPVTVGFTTYVMGELTDPWAGPMVIYGLAWIVLGRYLVAGGTERGAETTEAAPQ